jgi:cystathionine beta-lyase family protein involved in aluminum resistance
LSVLELFKIDKKLCAFANKAEKMCAQVFMEIEAVAEYHQQRMLKAFIDSKVSERHFCASTGYGYGDDGRDKLDEIYSRVFEAEDALVRHNFTSGTHALTVALFGMLRPGDTLICVTGEPYDTLKGVIGFERNAPGSLKEFGINYQQINLTSIGKPDYNEIEKAIKPSSTLIYLQRSRGYSLRSSLCANEISKISKLSKKLSPNCVVMLDNCYGEFVEAEEPLSLGVDLIAGSLIKNPGGGVARSGGYIAGKKDLVEKCAHRLGAPGTGREVGATLGHNRELFMGAFHAPHVTGEALKSAIFSAALFELMGYDVTPRYDDTRSDITQAIRFGNEERLVAFCQGLQKGSPIDAFLKPEPWDMPGYENKVIMAAGTFTQGASIELSADAPLREPYSVWLQGGLNFHSAKVGILMAAEEVLKLK